MQPNMDNALKFHPSAKNLLGKFCLFSVVILERFENHEEMYHCPLLNALSMKNSQSLKCFDNL